MAVENTYQIGNSHVALRVLPLTLRSAALNLRIVKEAGLRQSLFLRRQPHQFPACQRRQYLPFEPMCRTRVMFRRLVGLRILNLSRRM
jgi:hypothetical protein